jgi:hypothetical protein
MNARFVVAKVTPSTLGPSFSSGFDGSGGRSGEDMLLQFYEMVATEVLKIERFGKHELREYQVNPKTEHGTTAGNMYTR